MSSIRRSIGVLTIIAGTAMHAGAQSALPPPPPRPALPEYVPLSERPQRPAAPQEQAPQPQQAQAEPAFDPTTVDFDPIWTAGADGAIVGPDTYPELAAIENNPLIDEDQRDFVEALIEVREAEMELVAQAHPRVCIDAVTKAIPNFDVSIEATRVPLGDVAVKLNQPQGLIDTLAEQGVLSPEMASMSHYIAMDYTRSTLESIPATLPEAASKDKITSAQSRVLIRQGLSEPLAAFGRLARRAIEADPSLVENADQLLTIEGEAFIEAAAYALAPLPEDRLQAAITGAYEAVHGPVTR